MKPSRQQKQQTRVLTKKHQNHETTITYKPADAIRIGGVGEGGELSD